MSKLSDIIKASKTSKFVLFRANTFVYQTDTGFEFHIPVDDFKGEAALLAEDKTIYFMRWIRKHLELKGQK